MNESALSSEDRPFLSGLTGVLRAEMKNMLPLVGRCIVGLCVDDEGEFFGFRLDNGATVWPWRDPEGNGPGHLNDEEGA